MTVFRVVVKQNMFYDSVSLMLVSKKLKEISGVKEAIIAMGTELNKELIENVGLGSQEVTSAGPNDLIFAIAAEDVKILNDAINKAENSLQRRGSSSRAVKQAPNSLDNALRIVPEANLAVISLPGVYAAREARKALENNLHVMLFSDNVTLNDEITLKSIAHEKGLLLMGPDCGTAIINHVPLCFANTVRQGNIGIVTASGTGAQEVAALIDRLGSGISQVIGTGGRDLHANVGGMMMLDAIQALEEDPQTDIIVIISKPPAPAIAHKVLTAIRDVKKQKVVCFLGAKWEELGKDGITLGHNLEDTARKAVFLAQGETIDSSRDYSYDNNFEETRELIEKERSSFAPEQKYIRALYTGGTLCNEAIIELQKHVGGIYSNICKSPEFLLEDVTRSKDNTAIDLGDDKFTLGRPHPMIDPTIRLVRLLQEAEDPATAVILLDVVLGSGSHSDPAGVLVPIVKESKDKADKRGRHLSVVASLCGTYNDPQNFVEQEKKLKDAGVIVAFSNIQATRIAAAIAKDL